MRLMPDKRLLNFLVIVVLTCITFVWTFFIFRQPVIWWAIGFVVLLRCLFSFLILQDFSLSWSKASPTTFLIKSIVNIVAAIIYIPILYGKVRLAFMASELFFYIFSYSFLMYFYWYVNNRGSVSKTKSLVIYGAGKAGTKLQNEFRETSFNLICFIDDDKDMQKRSVDGVKILSLQTFKEKFKDRKMDLLVVAMPSVRKTRTKEIFDETISYFNKVKILPSLDEILREKDFSLQLKDISLEDLLARNPKDLDKKSISNFINNKIVMITGAGGSIGSEIVRQCIKYKAKKIVLLDHSEYNLYKITEEINGFIDFSSILQSVTNTTLLDKTFSTHKPEVVIHAAAYKHVPLVEDNMQDAIINNIVGTKNTIDISIKYNVKKFILISTDKAVRPTNVMGATKRICELYAQNVDSKNSEIAAVRFGNVLGSSGSVIPKFQEQIEKGGPVTVTHPDITRYFMLIPEACELVLQAASIAKGGEIFILDMGNPVKIYNLAKKMISLSGKNDIDIVFTGLRHGEKLYEELLIDESENKTTYESITVAKKTNYNIDELNKDIEKLLSSENKIEQLQHIVKEYTPKH
ncbi:MAG: polysaccharide biosynthesis protein [Campylobacteraceae bacterium]